MFANYEILLKQKQLLIEYDVFKSQEELAREEYLIALQMKFLCEILSESFFTEKHFTFPDQTIVTIIVVSQTILFTGNDL